MNIALIAHDRKKELMVQFCMAGDGGACEDLDVLHRAERVQVL